MKQQHRFFPALLFVLCICCSFPQCDNGTGTGTETETEAEAGNKKSQEEVDKNPLFLVKQNGQYGYIDRDGKMVIAPQFQNAYPFHGNRARIETDSAYGFIDKTGKVVIAPVYPLEKKNIELVYSGTPPFIEPQCFSEGLACVKIGGLCGFIDTTGKVVIEPRYGNASEFYGGYAVVQEKEDKGLYGFIDRTGKLVIPCRFETAFVFMEGLAAVSEGGQYGYIDTKGAFVIPPKFFRARNFHDGRAHVLTEMGKAAYIDRQGKIIVASSGEKEFLHGNGFWESFAGVNTKEGEGFMDTTGKIVAVDKAFDLYAMSVFSEGLMPLQLRDLQPDQIAYVDPTGKIVLRTEYVMATPFRYGLARGWRETGPGAEWEYIDTKGNVIWKP